MKRGILYKIYFTLVFFDIRIRTYKVAYKIKQDFSFNVVIINLKYHFLHFDCFVLVVFLEHPLCITDEQTISLLKISNA